MRKLLATFASAAPLLAVVVAASASAKTPPPVKRPSFKDGRQVMHTILDTYAIGIDGRLVLGGCRRHARLWIVCRARIDRRNSVTRYRFRISEAADDYVISSDVTTVRRDMSR